MIFVDTNYFLRLLLRDEDRQFQIAQKLFAEGAIGKVKLCTSVIVFFELYWVLTTFYGKKKKEVTEVLGDILKMSFVQFESREVLEKALAIYKDNNLDLEDSYNLIYARQLQVNTYETFDIKLKKKFKRV